MKIIRKNKKYILLGFLFGILALSITFFGIINASKNADAYISVTSTTATSGDFYAELKGKTDLSEVQLKLVATDEKCTHMVVNTEAGEVNVCNFYAYSIPEDAISSFYDITFILGTENAAKYNNRPCRIYITHHDGKQEIRTGVFQDGRMIVHMDKLSLFSIVATPNPTPDGDSTNKGGISPKTGD